MNKLLQELPAFVKSFESLTSDVQRNCEIVIAPPATHLTTLQPQLGAIGLGAQNCGTSKFGAFTGETSPAVLKEIKCTWVIIGHSERRHLYREDDSLILMRSKAALDEGLKVILCVGEILQDRKAGNTFKVIQSQLSILKESRFPQNAFERLVIAYEPVWAIGTGENATPQQAEEVHAMIRDWFSHNLSLEKAQNIRILYGGSVKPENSAQIMSQKDVDGLLVGTSSLDPTVFASVIRNGLKSHIETKKELT